MSFNVSWNSGNGGANFCYDILIDASGWNFFIGALMSVKIGPWHVVPIFHLHRAYTLSFLEFRFAVIQIFLGLLERKRCKSDDSFVSEILRFGGRKMILRF